MKLTSIFPAIRRSMLLATVFVGAFAQAQNPAPTFTPGAVFTATQFAGPDRLIEIPVGGGNLAASAGLATLPSRCPGQIAWSVDREFAYVTLFDLDKVVRVSATGVVSDFATNVPGPTGIVQLSDGRVLVAAWKSNTIRDITAGGAGPHSVYIAATEPRNLVQTRTGRVLVCEQLSPTVRDITNPAAPLSFATLGSSGPREIMETTAGRVFVATTDGLVKEITGGGDFSATPPFAVGQFFAGLTENANGRILAVGAHVHRIFDITAGGNFGAAATFATVPNSVETALDTVPAPLPDNDNDGIADATDPDDDNDGLPDIAEDRNNNGDLADDDTDGDSLPDHRDRDDDGDGLITLVEDLDGDGNYAEHDTDGDTKPNYLDNDDDNDGVSTLVEVFGNPNRLPDIDGDGLAEYLDDDDDGDGVLTVVELGDDPGDPRDTGGNGIADYLDADDDEDGVPTAQEDTNRNGDWTDDDSDGDNIPDFLDTDPVVMDPLVFVLFSKGEPVDGAGDAGNPFPAGSVWEGFGSPATNDELDVALAAGYRAGTAKYKSIVLFQDFGDTVTILASVMGPVPGAGSDWGLPADATFASVKDPILAPDGSVLFLATIKGSGVTSANNKVVVHHSGHLLSPEDAPARVVLRTGVAIGALGGASLKSIGSIAVEDLGAMVAGGNLLVGSGTPAVTLANDAVALAVHRSSADATLSVLLREGSSPGGGLPAVKSFVTLVSGSGTGGHGRGWLLRDTFDYDLFEPGPAAFTALATYTDGRRALIRNTFENGDIPTEQVITAKAPGGLGLEGLAGSFFKATGVPIRWMAPEAFAFRGTPNSGAAGLFLGDTGTHEARPASGVRIGQAIGSTGLSYKSVKDPVVSLFGCNLAFGATVTETGVTSANDAVIMGGAVDGPAPEVLAREGAAAAEADGAVWKSFTSLAVPCGFTGPVFTASLVNRTVTPTGILPGPGNTTSVNDMGLWGVDSNGAARLLLREGQPLNGKFVKSFNVLKIAGSAGGTTRSFNNYGEIIALVTATDGTSHIALIVVP